MGETPAVTAPRDDDELSLIDITLALAESWRLLVLVPLGAGLIALGVSFLIPPTYTATTRILPPAPQQSATAALSSQLGLLAGLAGSAVGIKNPADQYVALLKSRSVYDALIARFGLKQLYDVQYLEDARKRLDERTTVVAGAKDGMVMVEVEDHDPQRAADIANAFVDELRNLTKTLAIGEAAQRRLFFEQQLAEAKENLAKAEVALQASGVSESALRTVPQSALESLARLKAQITAQEIKLASMRMFMTDSNPEFRLAVKELAALREELNRTEQSTPGKAAGGAEYIARYRDFKYHETLYELMAKQYELARLDEAREGSVIQVVDAARTPERRSKPRRAQISVLTIVGTLFLTVLGVFLRRAVNRAISDPSAATKVARLRRALGLRPSSYSPRHE